MIDMNSSEKIDEKWCENLNLLEGPHGIQILPNDNKDIISRILKALRDTEGLPSDMDKPENETQAEVINKYADNLFDLFCEGANIAKSLRIGDQVHKIYQQNLEKIGNNTHRYIETEPSKDIPNG